MPDNYKIKRNQNERVKKYIINIIDTLGEKINHTKMPWTVKEDYDLKKNLYVKVNV